MLAELGKQGAVSCWQSWGKKELFHVGGAGATMSCIMLTQPQNSKNLYHVGGA
jgi:hypothetical protein